MSNQAQHKESNPDDKEEEKQLTASSSLAASSSLHKSSLPDIKAIETRIIKTKTEVDKAFDKLNSLKALAKEYEAGGSKRKQEGKKDSESKISDNDEF